MAKIEQSIDVDRPVRTVYNQWTQFEEFPEFMEGVESVTQLDDTHMHWVAKIAGERREWRARVTEQIPDNRVAWTSEDGAKNAGAVTFHKIDPHTTRIMLQLEFDPEGFAENVADKLGLLRSRAKSDLKRFKDFIESRPAETGAWRGTVDQEK